MKHEHFLFVAKTCFALGIAALLFAVVSALAGCWGGKPDVVYVTRTVTVHDEPRSCQRLEYDVGGAKAWSRDDHLERFPSIADVGKSQFVYDLGAWVVAAGQCLGIEVYDVSWYIEPFTRWTGEQGANP